MVNLQTSGAVRTCPAQQHECVRGVFTAYKSL